MVRSLGSSIGGPRDSQTQYGREDIGWSSEEQAIYQQGARRLDSRVDLGEAKGVHHCRDERSDSSSCGLGSLNESQHPHLVIGDGKFERLSDRYTATAFSLLDNHRVLDMVSSDLGSLALLTLRGSRAK
jgi:hypothetical protein